MVIIFQNIEEFKKLFRLHYNGLVNFVNSRYVNDVDEARDIIQATFMKIWNGRDKIDVTSSPKSYLYQVAKNTALDHIRKYKSKVNVVLEDDLERIDRVEEEVSKDADSFYLRTKIVEALSVLKPKTRQIFELHKFEGLTYEEIANHMEISKRTVESNIARALVLLRDELKNTLKYEN
jgi:RNA polymerase sigma-70 factor (ECF subfamily)